MKKSPDWVNKLRRKLESNQNVIIIHGNVDDRMPYSINGDTTATVEEIVADLTSPAGVVRFSPSGWDMSDDATEITFRILAGLPVPPPEPGAPPMRSDFENEVSFEAAAQRWQNMMEDYVEWQEVKERAEKLGVSPMSFLPEIPYSVADVRTLRAFKSWLNTKLHDNYNEDNDDGYKLVDPRKCLLVISLGERSIPSAEKGGLETAGLESIIMDVALREEKTCQVIVLVRSLSDLSPLLYSNSGIATIKIPKPGFHERLKYLSILKSEEHFKSDDLTKLAQAASGLTCNQIKKVIAEAEDDKITVGLIHERKHEILMDELAGLVEPVKTEHGFEIVGGLNHAKGVLTRLQRYLEEGKDHLVPMGILLLGPPGTGKTVLAEAFAHETGFNFIRMLNVRSKWVGESESNMQKVMDTAKELSPCIVFVDEFDQEGSRTDEGDAGTSKRLFSMLLKTMSDTSLRGKVIWIACSNRPDLIDPAMKRPGRFDFPIALLMPTKEERIRIFQAIERKYGLVFHNDVNLNALASKTEDFTGADIEAVCLEAARIADDDDSAEIRQLHLIEALNDYILPISNFPEKKNEIKKMEKLALKECRSKKLLPDCVKDKLEKKNEVKNVKVEAKEVE